ncbi:MAG: hypothetical protein ABI811_16855 [Acidobacteriota bacterium]
MFKLRPAQTACMALVGVALFWGIAETSAKDSEEDLRALWRDPTDITSRDLMYGQGGKAHAPAGTLVFVEEDPDGNSPKFVVKDSQGVKWKVKLGAEVRPETAATRLIWAAGFMTDEDYVVPTMPIQNLPKLKRGSEFQVEGGIKDARFERMERKKLGLWKWSSNPFKGTREFDGLRVMMAIINNVDMKDSQNSIYEMTDGRQYVVSDLGATFGGTGSHWPAVTPKGDAEIYNSSDFITKITNKEVDFAAPAWPKMAGVVPVIPLPYTLLTQPVRLFGRTAAPNITSQMWIGRDIPRDHVRWVGGILKQLSHQQIQDAFRAAYYPAADVESFTKAVEKRIADLNQL